MLEPSLTTLRLFLHVLAASIWVGGQIVLAGLVPSLRRHAPDSTKVAARAFNKVAWPAFVVLVVTGIWSLLAVEIGDTTWEYQITVMLHILLSAIAGMSAAVHAVGRSTLALAVGGALGLLSSLGAMFVGLILRSGV
jgi:putative copper export protein